MGTLFHLARFVKRPEECCCNEQAKQTGEKEDKRNIGDRFEQKGSKIEPVRYRIDQEASGYGSHGPPDSVHDT